MSPCSLRSLALALEDLATLTDLSILFARYDPLTRRPQREGAPKP